jgi:MFS family permease
MMKRIRRDAVGYLTSVYRFNRNIHFSLAASVLSSTAIGMFSVVFNLYILSLGIGAEQLGRIVGTSPLAEAIAAIPAAFIAERIGFKRSMVFIYVATGLTQLASVATPNPSIIMLASFLGGLGGAGAFVAQLPFLAANSREGERNLVFSASTVLQSISWSLGAVLAGYLPNLVGSITVDITSAYRVTLFVAGALSLVALLPTMMIREQPPLSTRNISLSPYLWGLNRNTFDHAFISLFRGLSMGLVTPFLNVFFVYHLGTSREFFSTVSAVSILPSTLSTALAPAVASALGTARALTVLRCLNAIPTFAITLSSIPLVAATIYWLGGIVSGAAQPLTFAFAMESAERKAKSATAAWMHVAFVLGSAIAAPLTGVLMARSEYAWPFYLSAISIAVAGVLNHAFFRSLYERPSGAAQG